MRRHVLTFDSEEDADEFSEGLRAVVRANARRRAENGEGEVAGADAAAARLADESDFGTVVTVPGAVLGGVLPAALVERGAWICPARSRVVGEASA